MQRLLPLPKSPKEGRRNQHSGPARPSHRALLCRSLTFHQHSQSFHRLKDIVILYTEPISLSIQAYASFTATAPDHDARHCQDPRPRRHQEEARASAHHGARPLRGRGAGPSHGQPADGAAAPAVRVPLHGRRAHERRRRRRQRRRAALCDGVLGEHHDGDDAARDAARPRPPGGRAPLPGLHHHPPALPRLMAEFIRTRAGDRHIALEPPVWELTRATREALHKRATRMAYDDAHGQATMYASALGPGSVTPLQILQPEPGRVTQEEPNREDPGTVREAPPMPLLTVRPLEIEQHDGVPRWDYQLGDDNEFGDGEQRRPRWIEQAPHDVCVEVSCDVTFKIE
ncbi:hypothetical protein IF1G_09748 [Cordyceps javanica]|uniref:Uncharacterized protein n=1 Tax=Cordyceps javanica TaxID=43265 RepID=A0A545UQE5_9HYPO|nr:hypothetical protein IF1G_09748 [Cordyceps javanica]